MSLAHRDETDNRLLSLNRDLSQMAGLVQNQLQRVITAFERRDVVSAKQAVEEDKRIDDLYLAIDAAVLEALTLDSLSADQTRRVISIMKVSGELERVGDLAKNIGKRVSVISADATLAPNIGVARMGRGSLRQFSDILTAYATENLAAAQAVWAGDDELDVLYNSVFREIIGVLASDSSLATTCVHLVFIAKNFERVGDHATNIAEAVFFLQTGKAMLDQRPKSDDTANTIINPEKFLP